MYDLMRHEELDALGITESWHEDSACVCIARLRTLGYNVVEAARPIPEGVRTDDVDYINHGGVVIMAKKSVQLNKVDSLGRYSTFEYVCGRISSSGTHLTMLLIYRPGSVPPSAKFFDEFETLVSKLIISSDVLIITGDINVRLDRLADPHTVSFTQVLANYQLCQHVTSPTHSLGGILDVVITREDCVMLRPKVMYVPFSDHALVKWTHKFTKSEISMKTVQTRRWRSFDHDDFCI